MIAGSSYDFALVTSPEGVVLGRVRRSALEPVAGDGPIEPILEPGPSTLCPHLTVDELHQRAERTEIKP